MKLGGCTVKLIDIGECALTLKMLMKILFHLSKSIW